MTRGRSTGAPGRDATDIARAGLAAAIAACARQWQARWDRPPTVRELVHAFTTCLSARPDDLVADVGPVLAEREGPPRTVKPVDVGAFEVVYRERGDLGTEEMEFYTRGAAKRRGQGEVQAYLERVGEALIVDVGFAEHREVSSFEQACVLIRERVLHRYVTWKDLRITRVVLRPMSGLCDPRVLEWPPRAV